MYPRARSATSCPNTASKKTPERRHSHAGYVGGGPLGLALVRIAAAPLNQFCQFLRSHPPRRAGACESTLLLCGRSPVIRYTFSLASFWKIDYSDSIGDGLRSRGVPYSRYEFRELHPGSNSRSGPLWFRHGRMCVRLGAGGLRSCHPRARQMPTSAGFGQSIMLSVTSGGFLRFQHGTTTNLQT